MICLLPLTAGGDPVVVGQYKTPGVVKGVFVSGAYPYVVDGPSGLEVFDISGNKPIRLGSCNTSESIGYGGLLALKDDPTAISGRAWNDLSYNGTREVRWVWAPECPGGAPGWKWQLPDITSQR